MGALIAATVIGTVIAMALLAIFGVVLEEFTGRAAKLPALVIRLAVARLPEDLRDEYESEWYAEMLSIRRKFEATPISRALRVGWFSISLLTAVRSVGRERQRACRPAAGKVSQRRLMSLAMRVRIAGMAVKVLWSIGLMRPSSNAFIASPYVDEYRDTY